MANNKRTILVTGGSKGIGAACVHLFSQQDHQVIVFSRTKGEFVNRANVQYIPVDLSNHQSLQEACLKVLDSFKVDVLVNNAGGPALSPALQVETHDFTNAFDTQLHAFHLMSKIFHNSLSRNQNGRIINVVSVTANIPLPNFCVSNSLRGAIINWAKTLSKEFGSQGITVNNVLPGYTHTERLEEVIRNKCKESHTDYQTVCAQLTSQIPIGRFCQPEEIARVVAFLSDESSGGINGVSIPVDGGWTPSS